MRKRRKLNKLGISLMVSYVILISIAIAVSLGVYIWLKDYANITPSIDCKDGTSLIIDDYSCTSNMIRITVRNNGYFNVSGFIIHASDNPNRIPTRKLSAVVGEGEIPPLPGYYDFKTPLKPDNKEETSFVKGGYIETIQIQPYIRDEKNKIIVCEQAFVRQDVSECGILPINPLIIPGITSWWSFNGDADDENWLNNGVVNNAVLTTDRDGNADSAYLFDGVDDYVEMSVSSSLPKDSFTSIAWFKTTGSGDEKIISTGNSQQLQIFNGHVRICIEGTTWICKEGTTPINDDNWHFAAVVGDGTSIRIYLDGNSTPEISEAPSSGNMDGIIRVGVDGGGSPLNYYFTGIIDDVMIFNRALTESEIQDLYKSPYQEPEP